MPSRDMPAANVEVQLSSPLNEEEIVLATNSDSLAGKSVKRRELTDAEQTAIMKLVQPIFRRRGLDEPFFTGITNSADAADLNGDGKDELIGFFATGTGRNFEADASFTFCFVELTAAGVFSGKGVLQGKKYRVTQEF